ncbi:unnamed protein product [Miscanthus lutarioriparius]|uniref:Uncharacterized protein n=1 Tax=Miscanthus lutarioriparius TaxID=422564 RepID=A0A811SD66_9POAL|nr:unnamed protein product [Miscanthus lutarioriparius]
MQETKYEETTLEPERHHRRGSELLTDCNYAVMGETELIDKAGPKGYKLDKHKLELELEDEAAAAAGDSSAVVTVGRVCTAVAAHMKTHPRTRSK